MNLDEIEEKTGQLTIQLNLSTWKGLFYFLNPECQTAGKSTIFDLNIAITFEVVMKLHEQQQRISDLHMIVFVGGTAHCCFNEEFFKFLEK